MRLGEWLSENKTKIVLTLICVLVVVCVYFGFRAYSEKIAVRNEILSDIKTTSSFIYVHVKGAVKNPGLYKLNRADRVNDAVLAAGGFTDSADTENVNLAAFVEDGSEIVIPTGSSDKSGEAGKININTAGKNELMSLDGIGEGYAQRIIDYREKNGAFLSIEQITNVRGIGSKQFERIKDYITVG